MSNVRAELEGLRAALVQRSAAPPEAKDEPEPPSEIEIMLKDLRDTLANAADDAGETIAAHPAAAVGAAFLLGLIIGRISGRV